MNELKVIVTQLKSEMASKKENLKKIFKVVREHYNGDLPNLFVFPELFLTNYGIKELTYKLAEEIPGPSTKEISRFLKDYPGAYVAVGLPEVSPRHTGIIYNSAAIINEDGIVAVYRKRHLPNFGVFDEYRYFKSGPADTPRLFKIGKFKIGFVICYDAFFPESIKSFSLVGADIVGVLSAAPIASRPLWEPILRARAIENTVFILYSNHVGYMDGLEFFGESMIIEPVGRVVKKGDPFVEQVLSAEIDIHDVYRGRQIRPIIKDFNFEDAKMLLKSYEKHLSGLE
ncbi:MAG: carbon-nitrogen hydrolase family protein [Candidatus Njordarchaeia archaeon]